MRRLFSLLLVLILALSVRAQNLSPTLIAKIKEGETRPLGIVRLDLNVTIHGFLAETHATMTFYNPCDQTMEGDFYFPLPENSTVSGYALDINGTMVDGVAVEKTKGRVTFEKLLRRRIDPGLIEWTKGNNFKTRVFPIPSKGTRTIRVTYVTEIVGQKREPVYHLPLKFARPIADFKLAVAVVRPDAAPRVSSGDLSNFSFKEWHRSYFAQAERKDFMPSCDLRISLPKVKTDKSLVEVAQDGSCYFAIEDFPVSRTAAEPSDVVSPQRVVIFWDASGSRRCNPQAQIEFLSTYFSNLPKQPSGSSRPILIDFIELRDVASPPRRFITYQGIPKDLHDDSKCSVRRRNAAWRSRDASHTRQYQARPMSALFGWHFDIRRVDARQAGRSALHDLRQLLRQSRGPQAISNGRGRTLLESNEDIT